MYLVCSVCANVVMFFFFFSSRRRHTRSLRDWSSDVCSSDLDFPLGRIVRDHLKRAKAVEGERRPKRLAGSVSGPWDLSSRKGFLTPRPIPPRSVVELIRADKGTPAWKQQVGRQFRIGYYSPQDGLDTVWLVDAAGEYCQTTDHDHLARQASPSEAAEQSSASDPQATPDERRAAPPALRPCPLAERRQRVGAAAGPVELLHAGPHALAAGLEVGEDLRLVGGQHAAVVHHEAPADVHAIDVLRRRVVDDVLHGITQRRHAPRRRLPEHEIGGGADGDAAEVLAAERARA